MSYSKIIALALFASTLRFTAAAADVTSTWTTAAAGAWNLDANWSNSPAMGGFPSNGNAGVATYDAAVNATGSAYTVTVPIGLTIQNLQLNSTDATLSQTTGGVTTAGIFTWTAGTISGGTFNANGGITLSGTGGMTMINGAVINNPGACVTSINGGITFGGGAPCVINNSGTFTRDTSTGTYSVGARFSNTGTVTVSAGTLSLNGAVSQYSAGTLTGGTWNIMANSTLNGGGLSSITINQATVSFSGANSNFNFFTATVTTNLSTGTIALSGSRNYNPPVASAFNNSGTITAAPGSTFTTPGQFNWTGGLINGGGIFTANGPTSMSGSAAKTISGSTFNNNNLFTMTSTAALTLAAGQNFKNPGTFVAQSDAGIANGSGANIFNNTGTFTRNTSTGSFAIDCPFNNTGIVNANTGTLLLNGTVTQFSAGTLTAGTWNVAATLGGSGIGAITTNSGNVTLNGTSSIFAPINSLAINTGSFTATASRNFTTVGTLSNTGTLGAGVGSTINITGLFTWTAGTLTGGGVFNANAGLTLSGSAVTTLNGSTLNNPAGQTTTASGTGALSLVNNATFSNAGLFLAQSDAGITSGSGNNVFSNTGTFTRNTSAGTYVVASSFSNSGMVNAASGTLQFNGTVSQSVAGQMAVQGGAVVFNSSFVNDGSLIATGPAALTFNGPVTNNGFIQVRGGATLGGSSASFVNNGTLDVITASFTLPPGFVNNGIVLDTSVVKVKQATLAGPSFTALIDSYTGHTYQLQRSSSLPGGTFANIGSPQAGSTGTTLSFNDPAAVPGECFYRVVVNP